jgi:thioredoxin reductase (NADPH)
MSKDRSDVYGGNEISGSRFIRGAVQLGRRAAEAIVAAGRRGGEDPGKVRSELTDPNQGRGRHVLVVGGGNAAVETVFALLDHGAASVSLSYRRVRLTGLRAENKARFDDEVAHGRIRVYTPSRLVQADEDCVLLRFDSGREVTLSNDLVVAAQRQGSPR